MCVFSPPPRPSLPPPPPPPPPPPARLKEPDDRLRNVRDREADRRRAARGPSDTIRTGGSGLTAPPTTSGKNLLGQ